MAYKTIFGFWFCSGFWVLYFPVCMMHLEYQGELVLGVGWSGHRQPPPWGVVTGARAGPGGSAWGPPWRAKADRHMYGTVMGTYGSETGYSKVSLRLFEVI